MRSHITIVRGNREAPRTSGATGDAACHHPPITGDAPFMSVDTPTTSAKEARIAAFRDDHLG
ncbi:MAG: hypothetical protein ACTHQE_00320, partial [Thermomicrobiales bacterium]